MFRHLPSSNTRVSRSDIKPSTMPQYVPGMYETQMLADRALRDLLDKPDRNDWNELLASVR
jgi:hypothetical protein